MKAGMIVAPQPEAVEAGAVVLQRGGNAIDAGIACALVQGVVDPQMCGIAGFGSCQIYMPGRDAHSFIDFHGRAPAAARADMWADRIEGEARDGFGFILKGRVNDVGYQSITTPGSLKAYGEAVAEFGTWDFADLLAPAIEYAEHGVAIRPHVYHWWTEGASMGRVDNVERLGFTPAGRRIYFGADGALLKAGKVLVNKDLANTLRRIAREGIETFYSGEIAEEIAADMAANGGLLSADDLANYRTERRAPLRGSYRGLDLTTNNPPGGGIMLLEMLNILEHFDLAGLGHNSREYIRIVSEAMKWATIDKDAHVGDPNFVDVPVERLTDKGYAGEIAARIRAGERAQVTRLGGEAQASDRADRFTWQPGDIQIVKRAAEPADTTHISVIDKAGNALAMTHSLGMPSGVVSDGLGFMYNGCMGVFDPRPGHADSLAPGKSRFSSICPTIVFRDGAPYVVIGAPGGTQIAMGVLQGIINVIDHGMTMQQAIIAPRVSGTSDYIDVSNRIPRYITDELAADGYAIARSHESYTFASVHGIRIVEGEPDGGADPNHDGMALRVD